jgi:hypothetical protein
LVDVEEALAAHLRHQGDLGDLSDLLGLLSSCRVVSNVLEVLKNCGMRRAVGQKRRKERERERDRETEASGRMGIGHNR